MGPWKMSLVSKGAMFHFQDCWGLLGTVGKRVFWALEIFQLLMHGNALIILSSQKRSNKFPLHWVVCFVNHIILTLPKTNIGPKNDGFQLESPFPGVYF